WVGQLRASIQTQEGEGLDERVARITREREMLDREKRMFDRERDVLALLKETLTTAEREARERYLAPIVKRMQPYLAALFPASTLTVDENFHVTGVVRDGAAESFETLSDGTREQIAVLVRLAFAEML